MGAKNRPTPMQLGHRVVVGLSIFVLGFLPYVLIKVTRLGDEGQSHAITWTLLIAEFALLAGGAAIAILAEKKLKSGINDEVWQEDELKALLLWLNRRVVTIAVWIPIVGWFASIIAFRRWDAGVIVAGVILPMLAISRIKDRLRQPLRTQLQGPFTSKPLHSEHWGEGRAPGENSIH